MNRIECKIKGCKNVFLTEEAVSPKATFICKNHPLEVQVNAVPGRRYNPVTDEAHRDVHFQDHQFDKDLNRSAKPEGTHHIANQGSDVLNAKQIAPGFVVRTDTDVE